MGGHQEARVGHVEAQLTSMERLAIERAGAS
jgi:hypothetical protein